MDNVSDLIQVSPQLLSLIGEEISFPVKVKISDDKFVNLLEKHSLNKRSTLDEYQNKAHSGFYIQKHNHDKMVHSIVNLRLPFSDNKDEKILLANKELSLLMASWGISDHVINQTERMRDRLVIDLKNTSFKETIVNLMIDNLSSSYNYTHCYLLSIICTQIAKSLSWCTEEILKKIILSCLLHDGGIVNNEHAYMHDITPEKLGDSLSAEQILKISNHHIQIAKDLYDQTNIDIEVIRTIKYSHGALDDMGAHFKMASGTEQLKPLSKLFLVAHEFLNEMYKKGLNPYEMPSIVIKTYSKFNSSEFSAIKDGFKNSFLPLAKEFSKRS